MKTVSARCFVLSMVILWAGAAGQAATINADSLLQSIQDRYDSTRTYSADFDQETEYRTLNRKIHGQGKVYFSKPGKMLWAYNEPDGQFVLADGTYIYFFQPIEKQVIKTSLGSAFRSDLPLSFLLGIGQIRTYFTAGKVAHIDNSYQIDLYPKKDDTGLRMLQLTVSDYNYDINRALLEDTGGNQWTIRFRNIEHGIELPPSIFELRTPDGVDIVEFGS